MENKFILGEKCNFARVTSRVIEHCSTFSCGNDDLDDFFANFVGKNERLLLGKTYCWVLKEDVTKIVAMVTVANAGIQTTHLKNSDRRRVERNIEYEKHARSYPAALIGRIGVSVDFQGGEYRVGAQMMDFLKEWFSGDDNKTGCRFLLVDAYNNEHTLKYYERNGFRPLFPKEENEKEFYGIDPEEKLRTRMYYFDLILD